MVWIIILRNKVWSHWIVLITYTMDCSCLNLRFSSNLTNIIMTVAANITVLIKWQNVLSNRHNVFVECSSTLCNYIYMSWYTYLYIYVHMSYTIYMIRSFEEKLARFTTFRNHVLIFLKKKIFQWNKTLILVSYHSRNYLLIMLLIYLLHILFHLLLYHVKLSSYCVINSSTVIF